MSLLCLREICRKMRSIKQTELEPLVRRANQIRTEVTQGGRKPCKDVIDVSWGDKHRGGVQPLTFVRQVLAACLYPQLIHSYKLPGDVRQRVQSLLGACDGGSVGSYTPTGGISYIQCSVSNFISRRDGGVPSSPENIFMTSGSQRSIMQVLNMLADFHNQASLPTGVLTAVPTYSSFKMMLQRLGAAVVPYYLDEEQCWAMEVEELRRALQASKGVCNTVALYVINPGNPTGHVQSRKCIEKVIRFAAEERLFLMADEVYQESVFGEGSEFVSYKKVLSEMGPPLSHTVELASFHSASKGFMGECGLRGGYVELVNLDPAVMRYAYTLFSTDICAPVTGQLALELMANPPRPGDPSYPVYAQETQSIRAMLVHNMSWVPEFLNNIPGISCQPMMGGAFVFPRLYLPQAAIEKAKVVGMQPDLWYCKRLLEEAGVCVGPGCEYGQKEGTHHIRLCVMTPVETMEEVLKRLKNFHLHFLKEFS
ncbi:alanine aminotransferase 2-like isoform X1 [Oncorhynchus kisutch]|uniref:alanine transaminase n=2 Tax=Oncorhynchus kisutch TaxID=8019 RepID=A0A8C7IDF5_ONCKI|nr:alanine aminotransferase 2-like isoform X1 [Oncorhynchus kisutch]XP_031666667.1 alanine aminotransferase 2-like isoform X1 [Oncorhynchus kisutch]XP_031666668.1 alanine aminotransferase 2-like isoform X1 [Oncorhynchus kisutch]